MEGFCLNLLHNHQFWGLDFNFNYLTHLIPKDPSLQMVFGWGKKKTEEIHQEIPQTKEIKLSEVQKITDDLVKLRQTQTMAEIKSLRNQTSPLIKELGKIGNTLEKDNLKVEDIDKHLRIIVVRGKKQVIDIIKKDTDELPDVSSFDDILEMGNVLNQKLKRIGDVLGRQTRVIHIFAKKYAEKLKEILEQMNANNKEIQNLINNFQETKTHSNEISELLQKVKNLEQSIQSNKQKISESKNNIESFETKIKKLEEEIEKIKSSEDYSKFLQLNEKLFSINDSKTKIKNEIEVQFTKISRPLGRYEYASSLDKEQKSLLNQLLNNPFDALIPKNKDSVIVIFENVRKGILSGSISVKDIEKSTTYITETEEMIDGFINKINDFLEQKKEIQVQLVQSENKELSGLQKELEKIRNQKQDLETKISLLKKDLNENQTSIPEVISEITNKLRRFSNTDYTIIQST